MRILLIIIAGLSIGCSVFAQHCLPVKINHKWGLINPQGKIVVDPIYEAIGEFKHFGYAIMQHNGKLGLLNSIGKEVVKSNYLDIKVLDSTLVSVREESGWKIIDVNGRELIQLGSGQVAIMENPDYLKYSKAGLWGVIDRKGNEIISPIYKHIQLRDNYFQLQTAAQQFNIADALGKLLLPHSSDEVRIVKSGLILYRSGNLWGGITATGSTAFEAKFKRYFANDERAIKLFDGSRDLHMYFVNKQKLVRCSNTQQAYLFSDSALVIQRKKLLFLMNLDGKMILSKGYDEILPYSRNLYRVKRLDRWGIVGINDDQLIPFKHSFISPLQDHDMARIVSNGKLGLLSKSGEYVLPAIYDELEWNGRECRATLGDDMKILHMNSEGKLAEAGEFEDFFVVKIKKQATQHTAYNPYEPYRVKDFEWFYDAKTDKWGLRSIQNGESQINPIFDYVKVMPHLGMTLVGVHQFSYCDFDRTTYRFDMLYGMVNNEVGLLVTELRFIDIRLSDFAKGLPLARFTSEDGKQGLIAKNGKQVKKNITYIGNPTEEGVIRYAISGQLSGKTTSSSSNIRTLSDYLQEMLATSTMVDYTLHDQRFQADAQLYCKGCKWGYMDTLGNIVVPANYTYANDIVNEVGIVEQGNKWGAVSSEGRELIPCNYDYIGFLENTNNEVLRVYSRSPKYGLIDTLGQLTVRTTYEDIGGYSDNRLAVKRAGLWGFVNETGLEVIPCRFNQVKHFSDGLAPVKMNHQWGYINKQGDIVIACKFLKGGKFKYGLAPVLTPSGYQFVNKKGEIAFNATFDKANNFQHAVARVCMDGKWGLIDKSGNYVLKPSKYTQIESFNKLGLATVRYGKDRTHYGVINTKGQLIASGYRSIERFSEGLAAVKTNRGYGFINTKGNLVIKDKYSSVLSFSEGRAAVFKDGKCGYVNVQGQEVVSLQYGDCQPYQNDKAVVYENYKQAGLIDRQGNKIIAPEINRLIGFNDERGLVRENRYRYYFITENAEMSDGYYDQARSFSHGIAVVQSDGKWGIINPQGMEIVPPKYDKIDSFEDGYAKVRVHGFNGLTGKDGRQIVQPAYEYISYAGEGLFRVEQGNKVGYFDGDGSWVWDLQQ